MSQHHIWCCDIWCYCIYMMLCYDVVPYVVMTYGLTFDTWLGSTIRSTCSLCGPTSLQKSTPATPHIYHMIFTTPHLHTTQLNFWHFAQEDIAQLNSKRSRRSATFDTYIDTISTPDPQLLTQHRMFGSINMPIEVSQAFEPQKLTKKSTKKVLKKYPKHCQRHNGPRVLTL